MSLTTETIYDAEQKIWSGPKTERKYGPNETIGEVVLNVLKKNPAKVMQISDTTGEQKTAAGLLRDSVLIATYLMDQGLQPGDVLGIYGKNTINLTAVIIASLLCGTPYNAAFPGFDKENVALVFKITKPKVILCDVENYDTLKEAIKELELNPKILTINGELTGVESVANILRDDRKQPDGIRFPCFELNGKHTAVILCSSGTTGGPKGITCSHSKLLEFPTFLDVSPNDVVLSFSTLFWVSGIMAMSTALLNGATQIITEEPFTPAYFYTLMEKYKPTQALIPTNQVTALTEDGDPNASKYLKSIKTFITGGCKVHRSTSEKFLAMLNHKPKLVIAYGLSEHGSMVSETSFSTTPIRYDCEGKLMPNMEARIIDQTNGAHLGPNEKGLLHIRTTLEWAGYYRDEEATRKVYSNGWLNTSDIAYFDNDGYLFICGRSSEVFKSNGFFVFPNKLESLILQLPGVAEVCVFPKPANFEDKIAACAIVRTDDEAGWKLTENIVLEHVKRHVMEIYYIKGGVYFVEKLPKTATGKVQQRNVYKLCMDLENGHSSNDF